MNLTKDEKKLLEELICSNESWDSKKFEKLKIKMKDQFLENSRLCCYCSKNFYGEFKLVIDIEHILPKSIFYEQKFDIDNLSIACKRCNMQIKKDNIDFLDLEFIEIANFFKFQKNESERIKFVSELNSELCLNNKLQYKKSKFYKFIHPNFDDYFEHIDIVELRKNNKIFKKYYPLKEKGHYTYKYFKLEELEQGNLDEFQGLESVEKNCELNLGNCI